MGRGPKVSRYDRWQTVGIYWFRFLSSDRKSGSVYEIAAASLIITRKIKAFSPGMIIAYRLVHATDRTHHTAPSNAAYHRTQHQQDPDVQER